MLQLDVVVEVVVVFAVVGAVVADADAVVVMVFVPFVEPPPNLRTSLQKAVQPLSLIQGGWGVLIIVLLWR